MKMKRNFCRGLVVFGAGLWLLGGQPANATVIDFTADAAGPVANGFAPVGFPGVTFTDTVGANLEIADFGVQSFGQALAVFDDVDGSELIIDFAFDIKSITLSFGNDDPGATNAGDLALLQVFQGATLVGQTTVVMNRDDIMNQTIGFGLGGLEFNRVLFAFVDPALLPFTGGGGAAVGLIEVVDNITFTVPEPSTLALFGIGLFGMGLISRRRRRRA